MADAPGTHPGLLRPEYPIRTERLLLRPLTTGDADAMLAYRGRLDVSRYVPFEPMSREDILQRIAGQWSRTELTDEDQALTLAAEVAATGEEARLIHNEFFKGRWSNEVDFAMLADEWFARRG